MTSPAVIRDQAKARARELRAALSAAGTQVSHAEALERVEAELGDRDWNTASARLSNEPDVPLQVGDRVAGRHLKQPFAGRVLGVREVSGGAAFEVTIRLDEAIDVAEFESFSNFRTQVRIIVSAGDVTPLKTSNGAPHLTGEHAATDKAGG